MANAPQLTVGIGYELDEAGLKKITNSLENLGSKLTNIGLGLTAAISLPLIVVAKQMKNFARDAEESLNKVRTSFGESSKGVESFANSTLGSFGIARSTALDMAATFGDMATGMGISTNVAAQMSTTMVGLAGDLASFKNISLERANTALTGVFTGEGEALKSLGIIMLDSTLKSYALSKGVKVAYDDMSQSEKVTLRLAYVMDKAKNSVGDFAKTAGSAANQERTLTETMKENAEKMGSIFLPIYKTVMTKVNEVATAFNGLSDKMKTNIVIGGGLLIIIPPIILALGGIITAVSKIGLAFAALATPIGIFAVAMVATAAYVISHWEKVKEFFITLDSMWIGFVVNMDMFLNRLGLMSLDYMSKDIKNAASGAGSFFGIQTKGVIKFSDSVKNAQLDIKNLLNSIKGDPNKPIKTTKVKNPTGADLSIFSGLDKGAFKLDMNKKTPFEEWIEKNQESTKKALKEYTEKTAETMSTHMNGLIGKFEGFGFGNSILPFSGKTLKKIGVNIEDGLNEMEWDLVSAYSEKIAKIKDILYDVTMIFGNALGDAFSGIFGSVFSKEIKFDFKSVLKSFLSALGQMAISMGTAILAIGLGLSASVAGSLFAGKEIQAGLGLIALGGAMVGGSNAIGAKNNNSPSQSQQYNSTFTAPVQGSSNQSNKVEFVIQGTTLKGVLNNVTNSFG